MEELNLKPGHAYLLRYGCTDTVHEVKILEVSEKAYKVKWNNNLITWELKRRMDGDYTLVEDITIIINDKSNEKNQFDWIKTLPHLDTIKPYFLVEEQCPTCYGTGTVPNSEITASFKTCPDCKGSKTKSKKIEIRF